MPRLPLVFAILSVSIGMSMPTHAQPQTIPVNAALVKSVGFKEELEKLKQKADKLKQNKAGKESEAPVEPADEMDKLSPPPPPQSSTNAVPSQERARPEQQPAAQKAPAAPAECTPGKDLVIEYGDVCSGGNGNRKIYLHNTSAKMISAAVEVDVRSKNGELTHPTLGGDFIERFRRDLACGVSAKIKMCRFNH